MIVDNNTPDGDNNINDFNDDDNHDSDANNDDNNLNTNDDNDDQAITIFHTVHFREPLISKKPRFLARNHV